MKLKIRLLVVCCLLGSLTFSREIREALDISDFKGGVIVHVGCSSGKATALLADAANPTVEGLDTSREAVLEARKFFNTEGILGRVTAAVFDGKSLPYADNMINLLIVEKRYDLTEEEMFRVLCPNGVLCTVREEEWSTRSKTIPEALDEWTHYLHDPAGTMVGNDGIVGPPRRFQWIGNPKWLRNHEFMSSMHAMVSSGGRIFYIIDEGLRQHIFLPPRWTLVARDAFNGKVLWKRPLKDWQPHIWPMKSGPAHLPRRLVALNDTVYATLGFREPVTALEPATGKVLRAYGGTASTEEILCSGEVLYLVTDPRKQLVGFHEEETSWGKARNRANTQWGWTSERPERKIMAVETESGKILWQYTTNVAPLTLTKGETRIFFYNGEEMIALDQNTGRKSWVTPLQINYRPATGYAHRMVYADNRILFCHLKTLDVFSAENGEKLWKGKLQKTGHNSPNDIFVINGMIWSANTGKAQKPGTHFQALDLQTGQITRDFTAISPEVYFMHQRCYPGRATEKYIMTSGTGTEFYAIDGPETVDLHHYVRGSCIYGIMPCNGLLYKPPDSCACHYQSKLTGFCALAPPGPEKSVTLPEGKRLLKGPVYGSVPGEEPEPEDPAEWPAFRHDSERRNRSEQELPGKLERGWETVIGGRLSGMTAAGGRAFVCSIDRHTLYALDPDSGEVVWKFIAGGRIDSPPTFFRGAVLFGSADGSVYCLSASDGRLAWQYHVAPGARKILCRGQLESAWPVHGSVLIAEDTVYCLAGRNMFFDGGMRIVRLNPISGKKISETILDETDPETGKSIQEKMPGKAMPVANPDVLGCDGEYIYMGAQKFNFAGQRIGIDALKDKEKDQAGKGRHLFCPTGFLDDSWFHRSYLMYGKTGGEGHGEYTVPPKITPCGRTMTMDDKRIYSFSASIYGNVMSPRPEHFLFATEKNSPGPGKKQKVQHLWTAHGLPLLPNAMIQTGEILFLAGPPDIADEGKAFGIDMDRESESRNKLREQNAAWQGEKGALLCSFSTEDGAQLARHHLDSIPVWEGMASGYRRLFIAMKDGRVVCWE